VGRVKVMNKLTVVHLDGIKITSKESFLKEIAEALEFPEWFSHNWDALEDCLRDLKGKYIVVWTNNYCTWETLDWREANLLMSILRNYLTLIVFSREAYIDCALPEAIYDCLEIEYSYDT
jgi:RNAse (barnase) inhibitor barstar